MSLSQQEFLRLSDFIYSQLGIKMPENKLTMVKGRLTKRLRALNLNCFSQYCDFLFSDEGQSRELVHLINEVTTNKTDFFREPVHFDYLTKTALPELLRNRDTKEKKGLKLWSAGCSTGEEPYTLSMVLNEFPGLKGVFDILATDISTRVLDVARKGIYHEDRIAPVAMPLRKKYLLRSRNQEDRLVRMNAELRSNIRFGRLNFMDEDFGLRERMDIIFCRNVIIYFDKATQETLMNKFCRHLKPGGYLFLGHSESLSGYKVPLVQVAPTIYKFPG